MSLPPYLAKLVRFAGVGGAATVIYAALAAILGALAVGAVAASLLAYALAGLFSYFGHKRVTFRSDRAHGEEAPRFVAASAMGAGIATAAPLVLTDALHLPGLVAIGFTCVAVPAMNFLVLDLLVFGRRSEL